MQSAGRLAALGRPCVRTVPLRPRHGATGHALKAQRHELAASRWLRPVHGIEQRQQPADAPTSAPSPSCTTQRVLQDATSWLGLPTDCQSMLSLAFIPLMPFATIKFSPWTALLFTAMVTWSLTSGVLSLIRMFTDEAAAPMNVVKLQLVLTSEAHGLRQELQELEQYYHAHNTNDLYYLVEECLHEVGKRWQHCCGGSVQVRSSTSYRDAHRMFDEQASRERARAAACPSDGPLPSQQGADVLPDGPSRGGGVLSLMGAGKLFGAPGGPQRLGRVFAGRRAQEDGDSSGELVVVTLMLLTTRAVSLPQPGDGDRVQAAVEQLRGLTTGQILDAQLLWTPTQQGQYISCDTLARAYPDIQ